MRSPNYFSTPPFDRASHLRQDSDWLRQCLANPDTVVLPVWRARNLVISGDPPRPAALSISALAELIDQGCETVFLGLSEGRAHFTIDLSRHDEPDTLPFINGETRFIELRDVSPLVGHTDGAAMAYARAILTWHANHRFCGRCGSPTEVTHAGHQRVCTNPDCRRSHFPRTDPAVIMLVSRGDHCLLGRKAEWDPGRYSALAGFVEPGESLEGAVAREVHEETNIQVTDVRYHSSQPWPFPASIMLGFYATATSDDIRFNDNELEDARWFTRDELRRGDAGPVQRPRPISIARRLIDDWIEGRD